jgi:energy-coupling factor transporter transmembrane protein EcfT
MRRFAHAATSIRTTELVEAHPERRVLLALAGIFVAVASSSAPVFALVAAVPLSSLRRPGAGFRFVQRTRGLAFVAVPAALLRTLSADGSRWLSVAGVAITHEGVRSGAVVLARTAVAALWAAWLTETLDGHDVERALLRLGMPEAIVDLLRLTQRFGRQLVTTLSSAWTAAVFRGALESWSARGRAVGLLGGLVLTRGLVRAERVALARSLRGEGTAP